MEKAQSREQLRRKVYGIVGQQPLNRSAGSSFLCRTGGVSVPKQEQQGI